MIDEVGDEHRTGFVEILLAEKPKASRFDRGAVFPLYAHSTHEGGGHRVFLPHEVSPSQPVELNRAKSEAQWLKIGKLDSITRWSGFAGAGIREQGDGVDRNPVTLNQDGAIGEHPEGELVNVFTLCLVL